MENLKPNLAKPQYPNCCPFFRHLPDRYAQLLRQEHHGLREELRHGHQVKLGGQAPEALGAGVPPGDCPVGGQASSETLPLSVEAVGRRYEISRQDCLHGWAGFLMYSGLWSCCLSYCFSRNGGWLTTLEKREATSLIISLHNFGE